MGAAANWTLEQQISELYNYRAEDKRKKNQSFKYSEENYFARKKTYSLRMMLGITLLDRTIAAACHRCDTPPLLARPG